MTYAVTVSGEPLHFPPSLQTDQTGVIVAPPASELPQIAETIDPRYLPRFTVRLIRGAQKTRLSPRWASVNQSRLELARLCIDRLVGEAEKVQM